MEGDDKVKMVHMNLLLPLFSDPLDQTSEQDSKSLVDPKETIMLYNILPINQYTGKIPTEHHSKSMGDNTYSCLVLHQKISSLPVSIASGTRCF